MIARQRLIQERKNWRKSHPRGFVAKPIVEDDCENLLKWQCSIPGPEDTPWQGGDYKLTMIFQDDYPLRPPLCQFAKGFYHPNVYPTGTVCH